MKKIFYLMLCMAIGLGATSCLSNKDDDDNHKVLTKADKEAQLRSMAGIYNGYIIYINDTTNRTDSTVISWQLTPQDSSLTVTNLPVKLLAQGINSTDIRSILLAGGTEELKATVHPYAVNSDNVGLYAFWVIPREYKLAFTTEYEGANHDVEVTFTDGMTAYTSSYTTAQFYAYGMYLNTKMEWYLLVKSVKVDGREWTTGRAMMVYGQK